MLKEIMHKIAVEAEHYLLHQNGFPVRLVAAQSEINENGDEVLLCIMDYGIDPISKNQLPVFGDDSQNLSRYTHIASICLIPYLKDMNSAFDVLEQLVELFEIKPFFQLKAGDQLYELSISARTFSPTEQHLFWIARKESAKPALFYQARVSPL